MAMFSMLEPFYCLLYVFIVVECRNKKSPLRIFGGSNAHEGEYPYVVRMEIQNTSYDENNTIVNSQLSHICTASAISSTWVLTAGHCVYAAKKYRLDAVIRYGHVENTIDYRDTFSNILIKIVHPLYKYSFEYNPATMKNDIGLMKTTPMNVNGFAKLSAADFLTLYGHEAIVAGYGMTTSKLPDGKTITNTTLNLIKPLQVLKVLISKCSRPGLRPAFCLAPKCGRRTTACGGDSGGPLIHPSGVIGVLSLGEPTKDCLNPTRKRRAFVAGYILPISPYIEWIQSYVLAESK